MRIVKTRYKVAYIVAGFAVLGVVTELLQQVGLSGVGDWWSTLGFAAMTVVGCRAFRVPEEDVAAPRPLWRLTGRPTAGFFLGGIDLIGAGGALWSLIYKRVVAAPSPFADSLSGGEGVTIQIVSIVVEAIFAFLYLRSSFRLARHMPAPSWTQG